MKKLLAGLVVGVLAVGYFAPGSSQAKMGNLVGEEYATIGVNVTHNQETYNNTIQLLGAQNTSSANTLVVDGTMINKYLNDGSTVDTTVYSSAHIQFNKNNTGVTVDIMTPSNILSVGHATYINAAITSGIQDATIKIASDQPVTGEGALAGIYAIMDREGVLEQGASQLAQDEMTIISDATETGANVEQVNAVMSDVKAEIAQAVQNGDIVNGDKVTNIVNNAVTNYNVNLPDWALQRMVDFGTQFAQTDVAMNEDTIGQLKGLSDDLFAKGGELFEGVQSKLQDPGFQQEAQGFLGQMWDGITTFFTGMGNFFTSLFE